MAYFSKPNKKKSKWPEMSTMPVAPNMPLASLSRERSGPATIPVNAQKALDSAKGLAARLASRAERAGMRQRGEAFMSEAKKRLRSPRLRVGAGKRTRLV